MQLKKAGAASPGPRSGFAMWTDGEEWVYVLGGTKEVGSKGGTETLSDLWRLSMSALAWEKMTQTGPGRLKLPCCAAAVMDKDNQRAALFGSRSGSSEDGCSVSGSLALAP
eukprot:2865906-Rhodomonas_salina.1